VGDSGPGVGALGRRLGLGQEQHGNQRQQGKTRNREFIKVHVILFIDVEGAFPLCKKKEGFRSLFWGNIRSRIEAVANPVDSESRYSV